MGSSEQAGCSYIPVLILQPDRILYAGQQK